MKSTRMEGLVLKNYSGFYYVQDQFGQIYECRLRGKLKQLVLSGDRVVFTSLDVAQGIIETVLPRKNELFRPKIANIDTVLIVMANDRPVPSLSLLDRLLVLAQYNQMEPVIIINKCDLAPSTKAQIDNSYYRGTGFTVINTSKISGDGIPALKQVLRHKVTVLAGPSGTGKSSLLNTLIDSLDLKTQEVSRKIGRGRHTTRHVELFPLEIRGWIADTPGFSILDLPVMEREQLGRYFIDFDQYQANCRFANCIHYREKECGVKQAVDSQEIADYRYQSYLTMLEEIIHNERCYR